MPVRCVLGVALTWLLVLAPCGLSAQERPERERRASLDARVGLGYIDGRAFDTITLTLGISSFYFGIGFYEESSKRTQPDSLNIEGILIEGTQEAQTLQIPFIFGAELARLDGRWLELSLDAQFKGGLELEFLRLRTDSGDSIPDSPNSNYLLGGGLRGQVVHPISSWVGDRMYLIRNIYVGVGVELDVQSRQFEIERAADDAFFTGIGYIIIGSTKTL